MITFFHAKYDIKIFELFFRFLATFIIILGVFFFGIFFSAYLLSTTYIQSSTEFVINFIISTHFSCVYDKNYIGDLCVF